MDLELTAEQAMIAETAGRALTSCAGNVDATMAMAAQLGWIGPDTADAGGLGTANECLILREAGRALAPVELVAAMLLPHVAPEAASRAGPVGVAMAVAISEEDHAPLLVAGSPAAAAILVNARDAIGMLDAGDMAWLQDCHGIDRATHFRQGRPANAPLAQIVDPEVIAVRDLFASAVLLGIGESACALASEHACNRVQFGRPIGSFQAVKHRCSRMKANLELAFAQLCYAAAAHEERMADAPYQAAIAINVVWPATYEAIRGLIQILGAMGNTIEHPAHLMLGRAHLLRQILAVDRVGGRHVLEAKSPFRDWG